APIVDPDKKVVVASGLQAELRSLAAFTSWGGAGKRAFGPEAFGLLAVLAILHWLNSRQIIAPLWRRLPDWACAALLGLGTAGALLFVPVKYKPFIYFQF